MTFYSCGVVWDSMTHFHCSSKGKSSVLQGSPKVFSQYNFNGGEKKKVRGNVINVELVK